MSEMQMSTNREVVDQAVLKIFIDLGAASGSRLLLDDLKSEWVKTRQRNDELIESVRRLIFNGLLNLAHTEAGTALALTPRGRQQTGAMRHELRSIWNHLVAAAYTALPAIPRRAIAPG